MSERTGIFSSFFCAIGICAKLTLPFLYCLGAEKTTIVKWLRVGVVHFLSAKSSLMKTVFLNKFTIFFS